MRILLDLPSYTIEFDLARMVQNIIYDFFSGPANFIDFFTRYYRKGEGDCDRHLIMMIEEVKRKEKGVYVSTRDFEPSASLRSGWGI